MNIALGSICRNSSQYLERYFNQVSALRGILQEQGHDFTLIVAESDSDDDTWEQLQARAQDFSARLVSYDQGGPFYGSVDLPERWAQLAAICNLVMDQVTPEIDALIYVESDLIWLPETMIALLRHLEHADAVSPMCYHRDSATFYDHWGFRGIDQVRFSANHPYHPSLANRDENGLVEIFSAGSCIAMCGEVALKSRFQKEDCIVGLCRSMHDNGYKLFADPLLEVRHP